MIECIKIEDLKQWKAERVQHGNCNYDDMIALGAFIETADTIKVYEPQTERHLSDYSYEADLGRRIMEQTERSNDDKGTA